MEVVHVLSDGREETMECMVFIKTHSREQMVICHSTRGGGWEETAALHSISQFLYLSLIPGVRIAPPCRGGIHKVGNGGDFGNFMKGGWGEAMGAEDPECIPGR